MYGVYWSLTSIFGTRRGRDTLRSFCRVILISLFHHLSYFPDCNNSKVCQTCIEMSTFIKRSVSHSRRVTISVKCGQNNVRKYHSIWRQLQSWLLCKRADAYFAFVNGKYYFFAETSVTINNIPVQDYTHPDDGFSLTYYDMPRRKIYYTYSVVIVVDILLDCEAERRLARL